MEEVGRKTIDIEFTIVVDYEKVRESAIEAGVLEKFDALTPLDFAEGILSDLKEDCKYEIEDGFMQIHLGKISEGLMI